MSLDINLVENTDVRCPNCEHWFNFSTSLQGETWWNITHNLHEMANEAGIGDALWHPEKYADSIGLTEASVLIPIIQRGFVDLIVRPDYYRQFDAKNGWGTYPHFVEFVHNVLEGMKDNPRALVTVSR